MRLGHHFQSQRSKVNLQAWAGTYCGGLLHSLFQCVAICSNNNNKIINNNNQMYIVPCGHNFRGAGGISLFMPSSHWLWPDNCNLNSSVIDCWNGCVSVSSVKYRVMLCLMWMFKFIEVKETHRCYRQDIADTLVSSWVVKYAIFWCIFMYINCVWK